ncbi:hypothetical protein [Rhodococcus jostii]|uniref:hypothetical protein n=1 Tax=Rhodococcus jostii TaxID=132919 RepID=UPI003645D786
MHSQTVDQEQLSDLDFNIQCLIEWVRIKHGKPSGVVRRCGNSAVADVVYINADGAQDEAFMCQSCLSKSETQGRVIYVHRI